MDTSTRLIVLKARNEMIRSFVKSTIYWIILLTAAFMSGVLFINSKFDGIESRIDHSLDGLESKNDGIESRIDHSLDGLESKNDGIESQIDHRLVSLENRFDELQELLAQHITLHTENQENE